MDDENFSLEWAGILSCNHPHSKLVVDCFKIKNFGGEAQTEGGPANTRSTDFPEQPADPEHPVQNPGSEHARAGARTFVPAGPLQPDPPENVPPVRTLIFRKQNDRHYFHQRKLHFPDFAQKRKSAQVLPENAKGAFTGNLLHSRQRSHPLSIGAQLGSLGQGQRGSKRPK